MWRWTVFCMYIVATDPVIQVNKEQRRRLDALGQFEAYDTLPSSTGQLIERLQGADIAIVGRHALTAEVFEKTKGLKLVCLWRTGYDDVDLDAASAMGVAVANAPGYSNEAVAEHVFALLLTFLRRVPEADYWMREGRFECSALKGRELNGKTMGVLGTGRIGMRVIEISKCFGMEVLAYDYRLTEDKARQGGFEYGCLDELYRRSDFISIHLPLTPDTEGLVDRRAFRRMKRSAVLINTARGRIVDEEALVAALKDKLIAGACLDVFAEEPVKMDTPLLRLDNVVLTPHTAFNTEEAVEKCTSTTIDTIESFLKGKPANILNPSALARFVKTG